MNFFFVKNLSYHIDIFTDQEKNPSELLKSIFPMDLNEKFHLKENNFLIRSITKTVENLVFFSKKKNNFARKEFYRIKSKFQIPIISFLFFFFIFINNSINFLNIYFFFNYFLGTKLFILFLSRIFAFVLFFTFHCSLHLTLKKF